MNLKETCLAALKRGEWTFNILGPRFRSALIQRIQGDSALVGELSMMELTLWAYRQEPVAIIKPQSALGIIKLGEQTPLVQASLDSLAKTTYERARAATFSELEIDKIRFAIAEIEKYASDTGRELARWITNFLKIDDVPFRSASHPHAFGCVLLSSRIGTMTAIELATSLVHEMGHQDLFLLNIIDRLIQQNADYKLAHAPFQGTSRPPIGRLHSYFALYRMIQFQDSIGLDTEKYRRLFAETKDSFMKDELTDYGFQIAEAAFDFITGSSLRERYG
jgi:hypothetical protein